VVFQSTLTAQNFATEFTSWLDLDNGIATWVDAMTLLSMILKLSSGFEFGMADITVNLKSFWMVFPHVMKPAKFGDEGALALKTGQSP